MTRFFVSESQLANGIFRISLICFDKVGFKTFATLLHTIVLRNARMYIKSAPPSIVYIIGPLFESNKHPLGRKRKEILSEAIPVHVIPSRNLYSFG